MLLRVSSRTTAAGDAILAEVRRGGMVESWHRGAVAIARESAVWTAGDAERPVFCRSAVKPFQALPLFERGVVERLALDDEELAVVSASHNGTDAHTAVVRRLLAKGGLGEDALQCGPHVPFDKDAAAALWRRGERPRRIHNNCSGKHAGFLLLAQDLGQPLATYLDPVGPAQLLVIRSVADAARVPIDRIGIAVDGCGAPTLRLPLVALARAFCRLVNPIDLPPVRAAGCRRLLAAITRAPVLLAGRGRLCTPLIESAPGAVYPKNGAEGVYAFGALCADGPVGVAIKVADGAERGYLPVAVEILRRLRLWPAVPDTLAAFARVPVTNTQGSVVGDVTCAAPLPESW
jgi:L-asparaginase II